MHYYLFFRFYYSTSPIIVAYKYNGCWQACVSRGRIVSSRLAKSNLVLIDLVAFSLIAWASARFYRYASGSIFLFGSVSLKMNSWFHCCSLLH